MPTMTISVVKGKGSIAHNNREFITQNIDINRLSNNIYYKNEPIEKAYDNLFGKEIKRYNNTQKRKDRKIFDYMEHIKKSKNGEKLFYETVVQVGNKFDCNVKSEQGKIAKNILDDYMKNFEKRNPNLYVFNAVLHLDEATPHLHIDYIPVAQNYKTGLQIRNSLDKALKQQGIQGMSSKKNNATQNWQAREKNYIETIMNKYGLSREEEKGIKREHLSINSYKAIAEQIANEVKNTSEKIESKPTLMSKDKVIVKKDDLERLEIRAKLSNIHEKATKTVQEKMLINYKNQENYISNREMRTNLAHNEAYENFKQAEKLKIMYQKKLQEQEELASNFDKLETEYYNVLSDKCNFEKNFDILSSEYSNQNEIIKSLESRLRTAHEGIANIVKAIGMFKYGKNSEYRVESLTKSQKMLVDSISDYGVKLANTEKFEDLAESMEKKVGVSKSIVEPIRIQRSIDFDLER